MKRGREPPAKYAQLLGVKVGGRTTGSIRGAPACKFIRSWKLNGISKDSFEHIYEHGGICGCDAMADTRKLVASSTTPVVIKNQCMHMNALQALGSKFDSTPVLEYGPLAVVGPSLSVADGESRVIVTIDRKVNNYACLAPSCRFQRHTCAHVETVLRTVRDHDLYETEPFLAKDVTEGVEEDVTPPDPQVVTRREKSRGAISTQRVTLDALAERVKKRSASTNAASQWLASGTNCVPDATGVCERCGSSWAESNLAVKEMNATLYGCSESLAVTVYERKCPCGHTKQYDGLVDGVFHYSNKTLWLHETMLTYIDLMVEARMPFNAYFKVLRRQYERRGISEMCASTTVIASLTAFINLLEVDYDDCFTCPVCSQLPIDQQMYVIDGKAMGFRADLMKETEEREVGEPAPVIPGKKFAYIAGDAKALGLARSLRNYAMHGADEGKFNSLITASRTHAPEVVEVLKYIKRTETTTYLKCPKRYRQFIYDISTPCPIACLIPHALYKRVAGLDPFMERILEVPQISQEQRTALMEWGSFSTMIAGWSCVPKEFAPLLTKLCRLAGELEQNPEYIRDAPLASPIYDLKEDTMSFFPNHPRIRKPRVFKEDTAGYKEQTCTKKILKTRRYTPGLFSAFCPHGICIGFEAMRRFESARVPFDLFYTRFPKCPGYIIYDNACNASRYCLRREPYYFSRALFWIDRMHQCNHVGCHSGYCINSYPQSTPLLGGTMTLANLNSQAAEQAHAKMTLIETQTSFMGQNTFMAYTKLFMAQKNKEILKTMTS